MDNSLDQLITEWLGNCWHDFQEDVDSPMTSLLNIKCVKCGVKDYEYDIETRTYFPVNQNKNYTENIGLCYQDIVPKLVGEQCAVSIDVTPMGSLCLIFKGMVNDQKLEELPSMALCKAVERMIKEEK